MYSPLLTPVNIQYVNAPNLSDMSQLESGPDKTGLLPVNMVKADKTGLLPVNMVKADQTGLLSVNSLLPVNMVNTSNKCFNYRGMHMLLVMSPREHGPGICLTLSKLAPFRLP